MTLHDDETRLAPAADETAVVASDPPTITPGLAWSDYDEEYPDSGTVALARAIPAVRWVAVIVTVMLAGLAAAWLGLVLYRDERPAAKAPAVERPPTAAPQPSSLAPPPSPTAAPPPPEPPHAAPKWAFMSVYVSIPLRPTDHGVVTSGFGDSTYIAAQGTLRQCQNAGGEHCVQAMMLSNGCGAVAIGGGTFGTASGSTRQEAVANAKANLPGAVSTYGFCLWDGNDVPTAYVP